MFALGQPAQEHEVLKDQLKVEILFWKMGNLRFPHFSSLCTLRGGKRHHYLLFLCFSTREQWKNALNIRAVEAQSMNPMKYRVYHLEMNKIKGLEGQLKNDLWKFQKKVSVHSCLDTWPLTFRFDLCLSVQ